MNESDEGNEGNEGTGSPTPPDHSGNHLLRFLILGIGLAGLVGVASLECASDPEYTRDYPSRVLPPEPAQTIQIVLPSDEYFPCSDCHEGEPTNRKVRKLEDEHEDRVLEHGDLWCLHCHDADDRDRLHLANDKTLAFEDSWRLCVQCHGDKRESWIAGVHGKRVGHWRGEREVWACVSCHDPHTPHFKPLVPKPPPVRPQQITLRRTSGTEGEEAHE